MVTLDRIRLTGLLRKKPWKRGFFYMPSVREIVIPSRVTALRRRDNSAALIDLKPGY